MKTVEIGIADGSPYVRWCDADICDIDTSDEVRYLDGWLNERGRWTRFNVPPTERLAVHIAQLYNATTSTPAYKNVMSDTDSGPIPLVYVEAFICQPKGFEYDWVQILRWVQRATDDIDLELFIDAANVMRGKAEVVIDQKTKTSEARSKGRKTLARKLPTNEQIIQAWNIVYARWHGRWENRNQDQKDYFLKQVKNEVDELRRIEGQISMKESWDVSTDYIYKKCSKLGLLK
jgi:hypothetical protein